MISREKKTFRSIVEFGLRPIKILFEFYSLLKTLVSNEQDFNKQSLDNDKSFDDFGNLELF